MRRLLKYSSPIINVFEKKKILKLSQEKPKFEPVFIIGPPRSGSTILFQVLTNYLDILYINNLVNLAKKNPFFGFFLTHKFLKTELHDTYDSKYGISNQENLVAPNEGVFWYKWLHGNGHYSDKFSLSEKQKKEFKNTIFAIINKYQKPFLIKNLSFSVRIKLLNDIFPKAKYIYIKREPVFVAQSIFQAKKKLKIPENKLWSIKPKNYKELEKLNNVQQISRQVFEIEKHINQDKELIDQKNFLEINYTEFCSNSHLEFLKIKEFIGADIKNYSIVDNLKARDTIKIDTKIFQEFEHEINKLYKENTKNNYEQ